MVWAGFEVGFGISVKNNADPLPQIMIWSKFEKTIFINSFFPYFLTFERYFKVQGYQQRTQHEKILPGSSVDFSLNILLRVSLSSSARVCCRLGWKWPTTAAPVKRAWRYCSYCRCAPFFVLKIRSKFSLKFWSQIKKFLFLFLRRDPILGTQTFLLLLGPDIRYTSSVITRIAY